MFLGFHKVWSLDPYYLKFLADLFFIVDDIEIASYVVENTPYVNSKDTEEVMQSLLKASKILFKWFAGNLMKINADKCHWLVNTCDKVHIRTDNIYMCNGKCEKLLIINSPLTIPCLNYVKKASWKIHALVKVTPYINTSKMHILVNTFLHRKFSNCPLIWMCCSRTDNRKINTLRERCLRIIYQENSHHLKGY